MPAGPSLFPLPSSMLSHVLFFALPMFAALLMQAAMAGGHGEMPPEELVRRQARSVHLFYHPFAPLAQSAMASVEVLESAPHSYFMVLGWDTGYCGFQELADGQRCFIFSLWDQGDMYDFKAREKHVDEAKRARLVYAAPDVEVGRFELEGTGARTLTKVDWRENEPMRVKIDSTPDGGERMAYTAQIKVGTNDWKRIATISAVCTKPEQRGVTGIHSFIEDFARDYKSVKIPHRARFFDIFTTASATSRWVRVERARFSADSTPSNTIDAWSDAPGSFRLSTGGDTQNLHAPLWSVIESAKP